jgi:transcriptional regulator with XRE-family HTH domain
LIYNKIKNELTKRKYSIKEFFEGKIGMTETGFHKMVRMNSLKVRDLEKISEELGVPVSYWFEDQPVDNISMAADRSWEYNSQGYKNLREELIRSQEHRIQLLIKENSRLEEELKKCLEENKRLGVG